MSSSTDIFRKFADPHVSGFDEFIRILPKIVERLPAFSFNVNGLVGSLRLISLSVSKPVFQTTDARQSKFTYPRECRIKGTTYKAPVYGKFILCIGDKRLVIERFCGFFPVMVRSMLCSTFSLNETQLVSVGEDWRDPGGYFIINGVDRILRMQIAPKRNFWICLNRSSFKTYGPDFSKSCVQCRSVAPDETGVLNFLHLMDSGSVVFRVYYCNKGFFVPLVIILRALGVYSEKEIFGLITKTHHQEKSIRPSFDTNDITLQSHVKHPDGQSQNIHKENNFHSDKITGDEFIYENSHINKSNLSDSINKESDFEKYLVDSTVYAARKRCYNLLASFDRSQLSSSDDCISYIGSKFKAVFDDYLYDDYTAGLVFLNNLVCPHLASFKDKSVFLCFGTSKLFFDSPEDDLDALSNQELYTPTQVLATAFKDHCYLIIRKMCRSISRRGYGVTGAREMRLLRQRRAQEMSDVAGDVKTLNKSPKNQINAKNDQKIEVTKMNKNSNLTIEDVDSDLLERLRYSVVDLKWELERMERFIATGNLGISRSSDLTERGGHAILADRINALRFVSHLRSVSRGNFFAKLKTTAVRKLRGESLGFLCPVHTPDGAPCGLITHLTSSAFVGVTGCELPDVLLYKLGMFPLDFSINTGNFSDGVFIASNGQSVKFSIPKNPLPSCSQTKPTKVSNYENMRNSKLTVDSQSTSLFSYVLLDGCVKGCILQKNQNEFMSSIRAIRAAGNLLIEVFADANMIYIATTRARIARPLINKNGKIEFITPAEQIHINIYIDEYENSSNDRNHFHKYEDGETDLTNRGCENTSYSPTQSFINHAVNRNTTNIYDSFILNQNSINDKEICNQLDFLDRWPRNNVIHSVVISKVNSSENKVGEDFCNTNIRNYAFNMDHLDSLIDDEIERQIRLNNGHIRFANISESLVEYTEPSTTAFLSLIAALTPFSDHNQSPRNMYQCQMCKQTMGTAVRNKNHRADNRTYTLTYPQAPMVETHEYKSANINDYPMGTNAIVAVLAYTAYDMEDAMVINRAAVHRGMCRGSVHKTERINLLESETLAETPVIGRHTNDVFYKKRTTRGDLKSIKKGASTSTVTSYDKNSSGDPGDFVNLPFSNREIVESVRYFQLAKKDHFGANIVTRTERIPTIGDKFCSRHGQKGVCSLHYPHEDMPFTEHGLQPDIIINPHAFPSRMTIGMLIESMAGKVCALEGAIQDGTPFKKYSNEFNDQKTENVNHSSDKIPNIANSAPGNHLICSDEIKVDQNNGFDQQAQKPNNALEYFGEKLAQHGYNYYGHETMYSGTTGHIFTAEIFIGVVYYQRLRHMVADKYQVRTIGAVNPLTQQPTGGRKRQGGIRVGEMERDAIIAHGCSEILRDRLVTCSDGTIFTYCKQCGSILFTQKNSCKCGGSVFKNVTLPYVYKYLCAELLAMNIHVSLELCQ